MTEFMVDSLNPHALAIVHPAALPVFRMYQMDTAVLEGPPGSSAPIDIFEPLNPRPLNSIKVTKI
jgi:hypothetical protein